MDSREALFKYALRLGDDSLVLGQRLGEWSGEAPSLELDLALSNPAFAPTIRRFVKVKPNAILLVQCAVAERDPQVQGVRRLHDLMGAQSFTRARVQ